MVQGPNIWAIGVSIPLQLFIVDPNTAQGIEGVSDITFTIQRLSDNKYWTGTTWSSSETNLVMTESGSGRYTYSLSASGNSQADIYLVHGIVTDITHQIDAAENFEIHVSRIIDTRVYELEPA